LISQSGDSGGWYGEYDGSTFGSCSFTVRIEVTRLNISDLVESGKIAYGTWNTHDVGFRAPFQGNRIPGLVLTFPPRGQVTLEPALAIPIVA